MEKIKKTYKFIPMLAASAALVFSLIIPSIPAKADSAGVASLDGVIYESLQEAVDAAGSNSTIELLDDVVLTKTVNIPSGKNITIKDNGSARRINVDSSADLSPLINIASGGELTIEGTSDDNIILEGDTVNKSRTGTVIKNSGILNLKSGTINGGNLVKAEFAAAVYNDNNSVFNMSGGYVQNTKMDKGSWYSSAVRVSSGAKFNLSGGEIRNNENLYADSLSGGGGVILFVWDKNDADAEMNMTGGKIDGNTALNGGGVYMTAFTKFTMTGGTISNNKTFSIGQGGGVCVSGVSSVEGYDRTKFVLDGGNIVGNTASSGGGIYVNSDEVYLKSGYIEGNTAVPSSANYWTGHGGGVYVSEVPRVLHVNNAIVTENTAKSKEGLFGTSGMGGGMWACPIGSIDLKVTNGLAVYGNSAVGNHAAGDDIVKVRYERSSTHGTLTIADRMLGGGQVKWYKDGGINGSRVGSVNTTIPR